MSELTPYRDPSIIELPPTTDSTAKSLIFHINENGFLKWNLFNGKAWTGRDTHSFTTEQNNNLMLLTISFNKERRNKAAPPLTAQDHKNALEWLQTDERAKVTLDDLERSRVETFFSSDKMKLIDLQFGGDLFKEPFVQSGGSLTGDDARLNDWLHRLQSDANVSQA